MIISRVGKVPSAVNSLIKKLHISMDPSRKTEACLEAVHIFKS